MLEQKIAAREYYAKYLRPSVTRARSMVSIFRKKSGWRNALVLHVLATEGPQTPYYFERAFDFEPGVVSRRLNELENRGYVRKEIMPSQKGGKKHLYSLTPWGAWVCAFFDIKEGDLPLPQSNNPFQAYLFPDLLNQTFSQLPVKVRYQISYLMFEKLLEYIDSELPGDGLKRVLKRNEFPILNPRIYYQGMGAWERDSNPNRL